VDVEAVTIDAYGTLVELHDPVQLLRAALHRHGVERGEEAVADAFAAEVAYYVPRSHEGRDEATLALLRRDCAAVFLEAAGADIDPESFAADFVASLRFRPAPGAVEACRRLRAAGLQLAVVSNWDVGLHEHLAALGLDELVDVVVTSAEAGAPKPAPRIWELALARLGVEPGRAVHVGDADADAEGARAAGLRFEPSPLPAAAGRILAPGRTRLIAWGTFVGLIALLNYAQRFSGSGSGIRGSRQAVYSYSTFAGGVVLYGVWLGVVLLIAIDRFDLLAFRPPRGWGRALALATSVIVLIFAWELVVSTIPLPQSPGKEQGLTPSHWEPSHAGAFAANLVLFAVIAPFVEELTFRGEGQSLLRALGRWPSILLVGLTFGLAHGLVEALLVLAPFGAALAYLRDRTASVLPGIVVHGLFNGIALAAALLG
jgi:HAD superfamily hydrolase (TIGR01509 family)